MIYPRKTYTSCSELPLHNFIKVVVTNELNWLYSEAGRPWNKAADLVSLWEDIFTEYNSISGNKQIQHTILLLKEILVINNKLEIIQKAVNYLSNNYDGRLCELLNGMGFTYRYTPETMQADLKMTISSAKRLIHKKVIAENEYNEINKDHKKTTEKDFNALITQLSKFLGFKINTKETTVLDYVNYLEAYSNFNKPNNG